MQRRRGDSEDTLPNLQSLSRLIQQFIISSYGKLDVRRSSLFLVRDPVGRQLFALRFVVALQQDIPISFSSIV